ncbi:hypothetical protein DITRI_Ditri15bG0126700 [Diplodiscus trichospermus]
MLVYEYLSNGTLASFLFVDLKPSWKLRTQIALGIARGLFYLHDECSPQIIHCDIKPQNILLDDYYEARISDFGLSKLLSINQSYTNTAIEVQKEIICCRRNVEMDNVEAEKAILTDWACDCFFQGTLDALVDNDAEALDDNMKLESGNFWRNCREPITDVEENSSHKTMSLDEEFLSEFKKLQKNYSVRYEEKAVRNASETIAAIHGTGRCNLSLAGRMPEGELA